MSHQFVSVPRVISRLLIGLLLAAGLLPSTQAALVPVDGLTTVAANWYRTCALDDQGAVLCWGENVDGDLGTAGTDDVLLPQPVLNLPGPMSAVVIGLDHQCAIDDIGTVWCWGRNDYGQLGDGTTTDHFSPAPVVGLGAAAIALSAGWYGTCAVTVDHDLACWGTNDYGQLGDGTITSRSSPTFVAALDGVADEVSSGDFHTCARTSAGAVWCWGYNGSGQLGDGSNDDQLSPVMVTGLGANVVRLASNASHNCVVMNDASVHCWGSNGGALGNGGTANQSVPVQVSGVSNAVSVSLGHGYSCALKSDGVAMCWGSNIAGNLGDGTLVPRLTPVQVQGFTDFAAVSSGYEHACGLRANGELACWGANKNGQAGSGALPSASQAIPIPAAGTSGLRLALGWTHSCLLRNNGSLRCWGGNAEGQVGDGTQLQRLAPTLVGGPWDGVLAVEAGFDSTCAIFDPITTLRPGGGAVSGPLACWGENSSGQLGVGDQFLHLQPTESVSAGSNVLSIGIGRSHACISYGPLGFRRCAGSNLNSRSCRTGNTISTTFAACDDPLSGVVGTDAGYSHSCALTDMGGVECWGYNSSGQLGDGTTTGSASPVIPVGMDSGIVQVVTSSYSSCALADTGAVSCWGSNSQGEVGDGTTTNRTTPMLIMEPQTGAVELAAGGLGFCARLGSGAVRCWGDNTFGQVGDGTSANIRATPVQVIGLASGTQHIAAGNFHRCALMNNGSVRCWGSNSHGQLGNGEAVYRARPTAVLVVGPEAPFDGFANGFEDLP